MKTIRLGLLGCGTVGGGVLRLLVGNSESLTARTGVRFEVARVLVRDKRKERVPELDRGRVTTNADDVLGDPDIDIFVEVMGGIDPTRRLVERAIDSGRSVVTANKMLLALHGPELVIRAQGRGVDLAFEASVGGGIPVVRVLKEALASDRLVQLFGIVNGTCNYILTRMSREGRGFDDALKEAQAKGYAEADPTLDVDGHDAAHKLVVLAMLAFGAQIDAAEVPTEGIRRIEPIDHACASRFGFTIKHLVVGRDRGDSLELRVHPALVPQDSTLANVGGVLNAIAVEGEALGPCLLSGRGAGDLPTAVSVVADVLEVARGLSGGVPGLATRALSLKKKVLAPLEETIGRYYLRFQVFDRPGVLATITGALGEANVSIEQMVQQGRGNESGSPVDVVMLTHEAQERDVRRALTRVAASEFVVSETRVLRVADGARTVA